VEEGAWPDLDIHMVGPGFFETLGIPLIRGRTFDSRDRYGEHLVAVISQRTADEFWPGEDPVGKTVGLAQGNGFWEGCEIVGIVGDVRYGAVETEPRITAYVPHGQAGFARGFLFVRAEGDPSALAGPMRQAVSDMNGDIPVTAVRTMDERVAAAAVRTSFSASLLGLFAVVALALSAVGIFGVLSYVVAQQTREIGIRMALGAQRSRVFRQVLLRAAVLTACGVLLGGTAALGLLDFMSSLLFEVRSDDPATLLLVATVLSAVSLAAAYVPAWRATQVQPVEALRRE
jgi:putative ABC transport system permease protein